MTKIHELRIQGAFLFVSLISFLAILVMPYCEGRFNSIWSFPLILPAEVAPFLFLLISCACSFGYCIGSIFTKRHIISATLVFLISFLLVFAYFRIDRRHIYLLGFRDYAKTVLTLDEWRAIDRFAREHIKKGKPLAGPGKGRWNDDENRALWSEFNAATQIKKLPPYLVLYFYSGATMIEWGGALVGHRAVTISGNVSEQSINDNLPRPLSVARDIVVSFTD